MLDVRYLSSLYRSDTVQYQFLSMCMSKFHVQLLCEVAINLLAGNFVITDLQRGQLCKYKNTYRILAHRITNPLRRRRRIADSRLAIKLMLKICLPQLK